MRFGKSFKSTFLYINQGVRVDTWIKMADKNKILNPVHVNNVVEFVCNYANKCDHCFVLYHLECLFKANYNPLESIIRALLLPNNDNTGNSLIFQMFVRKKF